MQIRADDIKYNKKSRQNPDIVSQNRYNKTHKYCSLFLATLIYIF